MSGVLTVLVPLLAGRPSGAAQSELEAAGRGMVNAWVTAADVSTMERWLTRESAISGIDC